MSAEWSTPRTWSLSELNLQPMRLIDVPKVAAIESLLYEFPWTAGNFSDSINAGYRATVLIDPNHILLGYSVLMLAVDEAHLLNVSVARQHQGRGYGSHLIQHMLDSAKAAHMERMYLEVRPSNPRAAELYQRFGFNQIAVRKGYYPAHAGAREDALVMERPL
ncbi:MAG: ribosomal-protein-alanine N-acetyltransferase [Burkholderiaceae bacterium]|nr:MAG: ribosomal-protein-alanine N-acetyltransferase [Burkholderiaceae bacterium]